MRIIVVGASGTIGKKVVSHLKLKHDVISVSRNSEDEKVDISSEESIKNLFNRVGKVDAIVNCAGAVKWKDFNELSEDDFYVGIKSKMMGQVNLVRIGKEHLNKNGSITLITGILADDPVYMTTSAALVNGGINSFVKAAARELKNGIRINVVSPGLVEDSISKFGHLFPGHEPVAMHKVVNAFVKSIEGIINGEVVRVF